MFVLNSAEEENRSYKHSDKKRQIIKNYFEAMNYLISFYSIMLYFYIIEPCTKPDDHCLNKFHLQFTRYLLYELTFVLCHTMLLVKGFRDRNPIHILYSLFIFLFMTNQRPGFDLINHGTFAQIICYFDLFIIVLLYLLFNFFKFLTKKIKFITPIMIILFIIFVYQTHLAILDSKKNFNRGFNDQWLKPNTENLPSECDLKEYYFPNYDFGMKIMVPIQKLINEDCITQQKYEFHQIYNESMNKNMNENLYQVYPSMQDIDIPKNSYDTDYKLQNLILPNIKFYKSKTDFQADYWINFEDKNNPKLEIDIKEKPMPFKIEDSPKFNIIVTMIDAISRQQFFRTYPLTVSYLEKFFDPKQTYQSKAFQFFRGQSFMGFTRPNVKNYRFGSNFNGTKKSTASIDPIEKIAHDQGYVTQYLVTLCQYYDSYVAIKPQENRHLYEDMTKSDHDNIALACDQINYPYHNPYNIFKGSFSMKQRCFLGENLSKYNYDFILDFFSKYKSIPKYTYNYLMEGHEATQQVAKYGDEDLRNFLIQLEERNILENTFIFFFSDHGYHMNPFLNKGQGKIELYNFFLNILVPTKFLTKEIEENLKVNEQRLFNHQDIHKTIIQLFRNNKQISETDKKKYNFRKASDLFHEKINPQRKCKDVIPYHKYNCICKKIQ